ncbi:MAG: hypothetical protein JWR21_1816 [Herminiimonas sp.]|nr:hypothetical protein [Herminiimonas sp.]
MTPAIGLSDKTMHYSRQPPLGMARAFPVCHVRRYPAPRGISMPAALPGIGEIMTGRDFQFGYVRRQNEPTCEVDHNSIATT